MSYTPTTKEVREIYRGCLVQTDTNIYSFVDEAQADGEFDSWLAGVKAEAWEVGYKSGIRNTVFPDAYVLDINPYRQEETE